MSSLPDHPPRPSRRFRLGGRDALSQTRFAREAFAEAGWRETAGDDYEIFWDPYSPTVEKASRVRDDQRYAHFRGIGNLCAKDRLHDNLLTAQLQLGGALYDFFPRTFHMPEERSALLAEAARAPETIWIKKPKTLSRGRGVELLRSASDAPSGDDWLVQEYLSSPHLIDGYKYTLRLYVLLTSLEPLTVFLYQDGFCKFASRPFSLEGAARTDRFAHLTNPDVLREDKDTPTSSRNLTHTAYRARLRADGIDDDILWQRLGELVALTAIAARPAMLAQCRHERVSHRPGFELLGLDVLIDDAMSPWLLECNLGPSLSVEAAPATRSAREEHEVKRGVVRETMRLLGVALPPTVSEESVRCGFDRILPDASLLPAFALPRWADITAAGLEAPSIALQPDGVTSVAVEEGLALLDRGSGRIAILDAQHADYWRRMAADDPIAPRDAVEWDARVTWWEDGWVRRRDTPSFVDPDVDANAAPRVVVQHASLSKSGTIVRVRAESRGRVTLPDPAVLDIGFPRLGDAARRRPLSALAGMRRLSLRAAPHLSDAVATELLEWLASRRYWDVTLPPSLLSPPPTSSDAETRQQRTRDRIAMCLAYVCDRFAERGIWHTLAYGTLLGALREHDVIAWDYDFDLLVKPEELDRILSPELTATLARDGYRFEPTRKPPNFLAANPAGVTSFSTAAVGIYYQERKIGDLYSFTAFADGVMRRWDFEHDIYWCPHSSFPAYFVEALTEVTLRDRPYPSVRAPEKWIEGVYGVDWRTPYRAVAQGGQGRAGATVHGDRYEPKLAAEIEWALAQGWDRSRYANGPAWPPQRLGGAGPVGPTARTRDNSRSLWWRDLDELVRFF